MQSLIAVIFRQDMDRAEAHRVELQDRENLAGLGDCSKMLPAVCDNERKGHLQYTHALAKDGTLIGGMWRALIRFVFLIPNARHCLGGRAL
jgi:Predicted membrane protein